MHGWKSVKDLVQRIDLVGMAKESRKILDCGGMQGLSPDLIKRIKTLKA